jgi:hypothetical protein
MRWGTLLVVREFSNELRRAQVGLLYATVKLERKQ